MVATLYERSKGGLGNGDVVCLSGRPPYLWGDDLQVDLSMSR